MPFSITDLQKGEHHEFLDYLCTPSYRMRNLSFIVYVVHLASPPSLIPSPAVILRTSFTSPRLPYSFYPQRRSGEKNGWGS
ncbi:hypothetical protein DFH09DRAFT_1326180 [Mycena vulgaris]|nr:hypothetical protein DFH09DRAFT_1326180 [Mycena vulgaris]